MVNVEFMDIRDDLLLNRVVGPFDSVQVTDGLLRDPDGNEIAIFDKEASLWWLNQRKGGYYSDFVITAAE